MAKKNVGRAITRCLESAILGHRIREPFTQRQDHNQAREGQRRSLHGNPCGLHDSDGDGGIDLLWRHRSNGRLSYWMLDSNSKRKATGLVVPGNVNRRIQVEGLGH